MARVGRPRKNLTPIEKEKIELSDDILNVVKYNAKLNDSQTDVLRKALEEAFQKYKLEKKYVDEEGKTTKDINHEALEEFLSSKKSEAKSQKTIYNYGNELGKLFVIINKDYREITAEDIQDYLNYRRDHDGVKPITIQNVRLYLMSFYKWAVVNEKVSKNPMDRIGTIKVEKKVIETFTDEEVERLRCACKNERDLAIVDMLSSSGMRVSELCGLNIKDVNFESGEVKVFGKGSKERICYLTGRAKIHLKWYLESRVDDNPALFVTTKYPYNRIHKNGVEWIIRELGKLSGVDTRTKCHPHKFRKTLATNMINKGADLSIVQNTLGHASSATTELYFQINDDTLKSAHHKYVS